MPEPLLRLTGIVKTFPGVRALDGVDLEIAAGEVHCLLGQNGAGKSTLIKVLAGAHQPDDGTVEWQGRKVAFAHPIAALRAGLATIYQELDLVDDLSVAENIFLGHEVSALGFSRRSAMHAKAAELLTRLGHPEISPGREVGRLTAAGKQLVSIARALSHRARLIIMDEPSAVLAYDEVDNLFRIVRELTADGVAVIYISHRLAEIREIGDRVTILKDGRTVASALPAGRTPTSTLVQSMTGRSIEYAFPPRPDSEPSGELLRVENLSLAGKFADVSFSVRAGEIVGVAGLVGAGRSELLETIYGARKPTAGRVLVDGRPLRKGSVFAAVRAGLGLAPEERKSQGLLLGEPVSRNISLASLGRFSRFGFIARNAERAATRSLIEQLDVRPPDPRREMRTFSGGNQQKALVGRWLLGGSRLLLLDEPTRGVDIGARAELYALVRRLASTGVGVLLVSSELPEVLGLADRVLVMRDGVVLREAPATELDEPAVLEMFIDGERSRT
ncbi:sugar ABC transporter ATP-binding protein [Fodinicola acaciae]|uniref:sugar ABC transporter ATP-binding protein n=1 Tax=Fodinicola acaciae TaxID=2681555 RepID=UPI0013D89364|nr:sugar ABC transporter ATP-binding protein [Fodinicola acaciae]